MVQIISFLVELWTYALITLSPEIIIPKGRTGYSFSGFEDRAHWAV
jgi:hypothetical protein